MAKTRSQRVREASAQADSLRLGMGWSVEDLVKPHLLVNSCAGEAHPGRSERQFRQRKGRQRYFAEGSQRNVRREQPRGSFLFRTVTPTRFLSS